jgi:hypothetical protein
MALVSYQGFDGLNNATDLVTGPFSSFSNVDLESGNSDTCLLQAIVTSTNARGGVGNCVAFNSSGFMGTSAGFLSSLTRGYGETISTAIVGAAVLLPSFTVSGSFSPNNMYACIGFKNAGVVQVLVRIDSSGAVTAWRVAPFSGTYYSGVLLGTSGSTISPTSYNYIELQATIGTGTSGSLIVRNNGAVILNLSGINTSADSTVNLTQAFVGLGAINGNINSGTNLVYFDDFVMLDTTGSAPYNTFLGDVRVQTVYPLAAGALTQWTPLASTNVSQVNETAMDSDASYNSSGTNGQIDLFTQSGLAVTPQTIFAVKVRLACRLDSAGGDTVAGELRSGGSNYAATAQAVLATYSYLDFVWTTDPATSAAWTKTGVNALQIGYNRVT